MRSHKSAEVLPSLSNGPDWPVKVLRGVPVLLAYLDNQRRFRFANHTHLAWLDIDPLQLLGRSLIDVVGEENYSRAISYIQ